MRVDESQTNQTQDVDKLLSLKLFKLIFTKLIEVIILLFITLIISICIEMVFIFFGLWDLHGAEHARYVVANYVSSILSSPSDIKYSPYYLFTVFVQYVIDYTNINLLSLIKTNNDSVLNTYFIAATIVVLTFIIKFVYLLLSVPLGMIIIFPCVVDGFVYRRINIEEGRLSSDWNLNLSMSLLRFGFLFFPLLFIMVPIYIPPLLVVIPLFILISFASRMFIVEFAKYF